MKKIKQILLLTVVVAMISATSMAAYAADFTASSADDVATVQSPSHSPTIKGEIPCGDIAGRMPTEEEQLAEFAKQGTADMDKVIEKFKDVSPSIIPRATTWSHLPNTYYCYKQVDVGACSMACAQATMVYLTGSSENQYAIAAEMGETVTGGATLEKTRRYLNANQSANEYIVKRASTSFSIMKANLYSAITSYEAPATLSIRATGDTDWPYVTEGHQLNVNAARDDQAWFQMADPSTRPDDPGTSAFYQIGADIIYDVLNSGYIY